MELYLSDDLFFHQSMKVISNKYLHELKTYQKEDIYEYLDPNLSYPYDFKSYEDGKMWVTKYEDDPEFRVLLKWSKLNNFYVLDFLFNTGKTYDTQKGLKGKNYLDTLCKILNNEIIPYIGNESLYFNAYDSDGKGDFRKNVFTKILDKFLDKNKYDIQIEGLNFLIKKK